MARETWAAEETKETSNCHRKEEAEVQTVREDWEDSEAGCRYDRTIKIKTHATRTTKSTATTSAVDFQRRAAAYGHQVVPS